MLRNTITILTVFVVLYQEIQARGHDIPPRACEGGIIETKGLYFEVRTTKTVGIVIINWLKYLKNIEEESNTNVHQNLMYQDL